MKVRFTERFQKKYKKLDAESQKAIDKAIRLFFQESKPASLRIKKIQGYEGVFEISGSMDIRVTFHYEQPETGVFRNCGHHDETLNNP